MITPLGTQHPEKYNDIKIIDRGIIDLRPFVSKKVFNLVEQRFQSVISKGNLNSAVHNAMISYMRNYAYKHGTKLIPKEFFSLKYESVV